MTHFTGVGEAYWILRVTAGHSSLLAACLIESVNRIVNTVFGFIPLRLGVDEGGAALIVKNLGHSAAEGVSLAVIRKVRTLLWVGLGMIFMAEYAVTSRRSQADPKTGAENGKADENTRRQR